MTAIAIEVEHRMFSPKTGPSRRCLKMTAAAAPHVAMSAKVC